MCVYLDVIYICNILHVHVRTDTHTHSVPPEALAPVQLGEALPHVVGPAGLCLDADLQGLPRSQGNVSKELSTGRCRQIQRGPPQVGILLQQQNSQRK